MSVVKRAQFVCHACMQRKKACDKTLPSCGFCATRGQACRYDLSAFRTKVGREHNPGKHFVAIGSLCPSMKARSLDESLHQMSCHFTKLTSLTHDTIIDYFFQSFHNWFPIISPDNLHTELSQYQDQKYPPPADYTVLYLSILLNTLPTLNLPRQTARGGQGSLYTAVKSAFFQTQNMICSSLRLVQAALLISLREYTLIQPEAAFISLRTGASMAQLLPTSLEAMINPVARRQDKHELQPDTAEKENVAWGIVIVERLILCEINRTDIRPQTNYPSPDSHLPSDLTVSIGRQGYRLTYHSMQVRNPVKLSQVHASDAGHFGRVAQVVWLLDQLLSILRLSTDDDKTKVAYLIELDNRLRNLLEIVMTDIESRQALICVPVSLCTRIFLGLHQFILNALQHPQCEVDHWQRGKTNMGLDMTCRMVLDVVHWHGKQCAPIMPICCFYNLRETRRCLQERNKLMKNKVIASDIDELRGAEERYYNTWGPNSASL